ASPAAAPSDGDPPEPKVRRDLDVEVSGRRFSVSVFVPESQMAAVAAPTGANPGAGGARPKRAGAGGGAGGAAGAGHVTVPMQGTIVKVLVEAGDEIEIGQTVVVLEAMKMENNINAEKAGTVAAVKVAVGDSVGTGDVVVEIE
ncbi:MAG TPA: biotin/lipoyl-containing protein, partial [Acidimicrobiales bacterium]|nr:biotin/lipoyl-containing protein [Acidimicrobiales bacterium]